MTEWTHRTCERCWFDGTERVERVHNSEDYKLIITPPIQGEFDGSFRMPTQVKETEPGACCVCGGLTITGIFFRRSQDELPCQGRHEPEQLGSWSRVSLPTPTP